jgi:hypothetical protein
VLQRDITILGLGQLDVSEGYLQPADCNTIDQERLQLGGMISADFGTHHPHLSLKGLPKENIIPGGKVDLGLFRPPNHVADGLPRSLIAIQ